MEEKSFINRQEELDELVSGLKRKGAELIILYGRRRVGKSRLLKEAAKKTEFDVLAMLEETDYNTNLRKVSDTVMKRFKFPSFSPASFKELFNALPDGSVIALDEYSYIAESAGEFQAVWEEIAKPKGIKVVLSGSMIRIMEDLNYSLKSPLYGRATKIIKLMPLSFAHVREWYGKAMIKDALDVYFCVGGIPRYLEIIETPSVYGIKNAFFSKNGLLLREGKLLLKESFPASLLIPKILFSVAGGVSEASKIANSVQVKAGEISKYLAMLSDYGFVEKKYPVLGGGKKDVRFYTADKFFGFWARFVWPHYSEIENGSAEQAVGDFERSFGAFAGFEFEKTIIETVREHPDVVPFPFDNLGRQWGRIPQGFSPEQGNDQYEIDICAANKKTRDILFAECKWKEGVDAKKVAKEIDEKTKFVEWEAGNRKETLAVFAKSFANRISELDGKPVMCFDLKDIERTIIGKN